MTLFQFSKQVAVIVSCVLFLTSGMASGGLSSAVNNSEGEKIEIVAPLILTPPSPVAGQIVTANFAIRNAGTQDLHFERLGVAARGPECEDWSCERYRDFPFHNQISLAPGETYTYSAQRIFLEEGLHFVRASYKFPTADWYFIGDRIDFVVAAGLQVTKGLSLTPPDPETSELVFASFQLHNASQEPLTLSRLGVGARGPGCEFFDWGCSMNVDYEYLREVTLAPGETRDLVSWRIFNEPGAYFAQVVVEDGLGAWYHLGSEVTILLSPAAYHLRDSEWMFAVHFHPTWYEPDDDLRLSLARSVGADMLRIGVSWRLLEPSGKGGWDVSWYIPALERVIDQANSLGMDVYLMLQQVPCWASSDPARHCAANDWNDAYPPQNNADYADAFHKLIDLYGDRVNVWEVWNEPNMEEFWQPVPDAAAYTDLLRSAYATIRSHAPDSIVLGGSIAGADTSFLNDMYAAGVIDSFDALSIHPYSGSHAPGNCADPRWAYQCGIDSMYSMMVHHDDSKDIWLTEFGWSSDIGMKGVGEETQKTYLQEALPVLESREFVAVATWYNLVDTDFDIQDSEHEDHFGLFTRKHRAKPAAIWLQDNHFPHKLYMPLGLR